MSFQQDLPASGSFAYARLSFLHMARLQLYNYNRFIIILLIVSTKIVVAIKTDDAKNCLIWCSNGYCDQQDQCVCDACWTGQRCDQLKDLYGPHFLERHSTVYIKPQNLIVGRPIFTFKAADQDQQEQCERLASKECSCANITYKLKATEDSVYFHLNETTGQLTISQLLQDEILQDKGTDKQFHLQSLALSGNHEPAAQNLTINLLPQLTRLKRQILKRDKSGKSTKSSAVPSESNPIAFGLRTISGEVNSMKIGDSIHYRLEMAISRSTINDLMLEIFTRDSYYGNKTAPSLSLFNFTIPSKVPNISFSVSEPKFFLSNRSNNVFDKVVIEFKHLKNTESERNLLSIYFSVILTRKEGNKGEQRHAVIVGSEYNDGVLAWVAESQITTASLSNYEDQIYSNVELPKVPSKIFLDSAILLSLEANLEFRSDHFRMEVTRPSSDYEPDNLVSFGKIAIIRFGRNYQAIPNNVTHYKSRLVRKNTSLAFTQSILDMGIITNIGEKGSRSFTNNSDNILIFTFPVFALNYPENVGKNVSFQIKFFLGSKNFLSKTVNLMIGERQTPRTVSKLLTSVGHLINQEVSKGGQTQLIIQSKFTESEAFVDYSLTIEVPYAGRQPLLIPCAARLMTKPSGFNLPYLHEAFVKPIVINDNQAFQFNFNRLQFLVQRNNSREEDNVVWSAVTFRVPFHRDLEVGTRLKVKAKAISGLKAVQIMIVDQEVIIVEPPSMLPTEMSDNNTKIEDETNTTKSPFTVKVHKSVSWEQMILKGGAASNVEIEFSPGTSYQSFGIRLRRDIEASTFGELNICKLRVTRVGASLPCSCVMIDEINSNQTSYDRNSESNQTEVAHLNFGAISVTSEKEEESWQRRLMVNFATMLSGKTEIVMESVVMMLEFIGDDQILWTERLNYSVTNLEVLPDTVRNSQPEMNVHLLDRSIKPGFTTNVQIEVITIPNTLTPLVIEVLANDPELSICGLWIHSVGDNMPCLARKEKAKYEPEAGVARLELDSVSNFGSPVRISAKAERRANTLELRAMVRVSEKAKTNKTFSVHVAFGERKIRVERDLELSVDLSATTVNYFQEPKRLVLNDVQSEASWAFEGIPKLIYYDIELKPNTQAPISLLLESSNRYHICSTAFVHLGRNYPCYSSQALKLSDERIELGMLCNTYLHDEVDDNLVRLAVAIKPINGEDYLEQKLTISSLAYVGSKPFNKQLELTFPLRNDYNSSDLTSLAESKGATIQSVAREAIPIKIREQKWIQFLVKIPAKTIGKLVIVAQGEADDTRAVIVVHDLRLIAGGSNIPCPLESGGERLKIIRNTTVPTSQRNVLESELGYFANFGLRNVTKRKMVERNEFEKIQDDSLLIEVLVELTDHPMIVEDGTYELNLKTYYGSNIDGSTPTVQEGKAKLKPVIENELNPKIEVEIKMKKRKQLEVLDRGDNLTLTATLRHSQDSNAEPLNVALRLFTPDFVQITRINGANTRELPSLSNVTNGVVDILFPWILFSDEIVINFTIQMDRENKRGFGHEQRVLMTPYRVLCEHFRLNNLAKQPCSEMKHISYAGKSSECDTPLGMNSGAIVDEQISASSAIGRDYAPTYARPNLEKYWSPAILGHSKEMKQQYFQIDFRRRTRVVRLTFKSIPGLQRMTNFYLCSSDQGILYDCDNTTSTITWEGNTNVGEAKLTVPRESRYFRIIINEIEMTSDGKKGRKGQGDNRSKSNSYLAIKLEWHGCYLDSVLADDVTIAQTHFTDDPQMINRHVAVDPYTNVLFFCDRLTVSSSLVECSPSCQEGNEQICYHSSSSGSSWNIIGGSIDSIEGFELASGKFYAIDYSRPAYFSTTNGLEWQPISFEEFNTTVSHTKFQNKIVVPKLSPDDLKKLNIKFGGWSIDYDGLYFEDGPKPKAIWHGCCQG